MRSSVRCGPRGVAALAGEQHVEGVGGAGERALPQADGADVEARVGVQAEDPGDPVERPGLDRHQGAAGHDLLGRLEDQAHPARHLVGERGERQAGRRAARRRAGRGHRRARHPGRCWPTGRGMRSSTGSASRSARRAITGPGPEPMSTTSPLRGSGAGHEPGLVEALGDHRRRPLLGPRQLGVGVQVAPELDQLGGEQLDLGPGTVDEPGMREVDTTDKVTGHRRTDETVVCRTLAPAGDGAPAHEWAQSSGRGRCRRQRPGGPRRPGRSALRRAAHGVRRHGSPSRRASAAAARRAGRGPAPR